MENTHKKESGEIIVLPEGFVLNMHETSNGVYQIDLFDRDMRSVSNHGHQLDLMVEQAISELL